MRALYAIFYFTIVVRYYTYDDLNRVVSRFYGHYWSFKAIAKKSRNHSSLPKNHVNILLCIDGGNSLDMRGLDMRELRL